ncbi:class I SAM-dependent methyltransferase [Streptomyces sp. NPDC021093]|uniref:class I SAM-dependent methyltransferase n=1 Tax=Streptomyces sp. NPDC021093 TaxID=3365112 RepID=UPI00379F4003
MPATPESPAGPTREFAANDYDGFAEAYEAENETSLLNAYYNRPAILDLAGDVAGRRVLDVGCGAGPVFAALRDRGATVTGFDASAGMLKLARRRLGPDAALHHGDLADPLPFPDSSFDDVVAPLVLHYLEDWTAPLAELRRVLKPGGRLIASVNHPSVYTLLHQDKDYFETVQWSYDCDFAGQKAVLTNWHRPLHAMTDAFTAAGFRISVISEPPPAPGAAKAFPDDPAARKRFMCFLFFVLEAS